MNSTAATKWIKYLAAFLTGYVSALLPIVATGDLPSQKALIAALAPALIATGLFHTPSPSQG